MKPRALSVREFHRRFPDEAAARAWFEQVRWPHGPTCHHCGLVNQARPLAKKPAWFCKVCKKSFSITSGTPMHQTHLPLLTWLQGIYLIVASSKGISAVKLGEMLEISYPSAWFMGHRIRAMMAEESPLLTGIVEIDEMYAGAAPRKRATSESAQTSSHDDNDDGGDGASPPPPPLANPTGRGTKRPLVLVAAQRGERAGKQRDKRGSKVAPQVIQTHGRQAIGAALAGRMEAGAVLMTDGLPAYRHLGAKHLHLSVNHSHREFARTDATTGHRVHVNTVEAFHGFVRRAVLGVWHQVSRRHLGRYLSETAFRWNHRAANSLARMAEIVGNADGRRLPYATLTASA